MYVTDMDISWMQSPFLRNRCLLKNDSDVKLLKAAGAKTLTIDLSRGVDVAAISDSQSAESPAKQAQSAPDTAPSATSGGPSPELTQPLPPSTRLVSVEEEMAAAGAARERAEGALHKSFAEWERGTLVFDTDLQDALRETTASLTRNDQALLRMLAEARREPSLVAHAFATYTLVTALLKQAGVAEAAIADLGLAAILHDFGWLKLPRNLLLKATPFTDKEKTLAALHTELMEPLLAAAGEVPERVRHWVRQHEKLPLEDNPPGLENPLDRRLLAALQVVDKYDELCAGIMGNQGRTPSAALSFLYKRSLAGVYAAEWVHKLIFTLGVYPLGSAVILGNREKGIIAEIHRDRPLQPIVEVRYNRLGQPLAKVILRDLSKAHGEEELRILAALDLDDPQSDPAGILRA